jgi:K+-sensing histidine kinase KdpD
MSVPPRRGRAHVLRARDGAALAKSGAAPQIRKGADVAARLDSTWIALLDAIDAAADAQCVGRREKHALLDSLEASRHVFRDENVRAALSDLAALDDAAFAGADPLDCFCGLKIRGSA